MLSFYCHSIYLQPPKLLTLYFFSILRYLQQATNTIEATREQLDAKTKVSKKPLAWKIYPDIIGPITRPRDPAAPIQPIIVP